MASCGWWDEPTVGVASVTMNPAVLAGSWASLAALSDPETTRQVVAIARG
jgi:hypothetical protein